MHSIRQQVYYINLVFRIHGTNPNDAHKMFALRRRGVEIPMTAHQIPAKWLVEKDQTVGLGLSPLIEDTYSIIPYGRSSSPAFRAEIPSLDESLVKSTKTICEKYDIDFAHLGQIQRKFLTHYRCSQCGLLPLYYVNLLHAKRVRCKKCGELIAFKRKGKYGKLRKEIAFRLKDDYERINSVPQ